MSDSESPRPFRKVVLDKPGLAKCEPERYEATNASATWFLRWCEVNGFSVGELQTTLKLRSRATAAKKRNGEIGLTLSDIKLFPRRYRHQLVSMFLAWCDANDPQMARFLDHA